MHIKSGLGGFDSLELTMNCGTMLHPKVKSLHMYCTSRWHGMG